MKKLEDIERPCARKIVIKYEKLRKYQSPYDCEKCSGEPGSCPNYIDNNALIEKYRSGL